MNLVHLRLPPQLFHHVLNTIVNATQATTIEVVTCICIAFDDDAKLTATFCAPGAKRPVCF